MKREKRRRRVCSGVLSIMVISIALAMALPLGNANVWGIQEETGEETDVPRQYKLTSWRERNTFDANIKTMIKLDDSCWPDLSETERKNVMEALMKVEANYLGIPEGNIIYLNNMEEYTHGQTDFANYTIRINKKLLQDSSSQKIVTTFFHETYHLYQLRLVQLYEQADKKDQGLLLLRDAEMWAQDFADYDDRGGIRYFTQACEYDARTYAEESAIEIYERIEEYKNKQ